MPNVSIIIPVYNAEKGIRRCIESVLNQEYSDYELILVDDGSKDSSPAILDEYAAHDARIKVIHKPNQGVSATRNRGLCEASGTYVQFMDADDWLPPESTKILVRTAVEDECDLVVAGFYRVVNDRVARKSSLDDEDVLTLKEYSEYMKDNPADYYYGVLWNKLYRRDIIEKYNVRMEEGLSFCEDFVFNLEYLVHCQRIRALNVPVYYYVKTEGGLVSVNMNPARLVQMKLNIYTYYDQYFRDVLDEKQYNAERLSIARFLIAAANDEMVIPMMPGTKKLGQEKVTVPFMTDSVNPIITGYYHKKLFAGYLDRVAISHDLSLREVSVFAALLFAGEALYSKGIADFTGINELVVMTILQKLILQNYVVQKFKEGSDLPVYTAAEGTLKKDVLEACDDLRQLSIKGFSEEEKEKLEEFMKRMDDNLKAYMKQDVQ